MCGKHRITGALGLTCAVLAMLGCSSTKYRAIYEAYAEQASEERGLQFEDSFFRFDFVPLNNGLYFQIFNKTSQPAYLDWDRTYFLRPDGNSSKAVNTDILDTADELASKEKYESVVPPHARLARFTTAAPHLSSVSYTTVNTIMQTVRFGDNMMFLTSGSVASRRAFSAGAYWPSRVIIEANRDGVDMLLPSGRRLADFLVRNNKMGIGFYLLHGDEVREYRFDFRFKKVGIYEEKTKGSRHQRTTLHLRYTATDDSNWLWQESE